jgi:hypothetical protein
MWRYDPDEMTRTHECTPAYQFRREATEAIMAHLSDSVTPEQYLLALAALREMTEQWCQSLDAFHRSPLYGRHPCIPEASDSLRRQIQGAMLLKPAPQSETAQPPAAPAPPPKPQTIREVLEGIARGKTEDTGGNRPVPPNGA